MSTRPTCKVDGEAGSYLSEFRAALRAQGIECSQSASTTAIAAGMGSADVIPLVRSAAQTSRTVVVVDGRSDASRDLAWCTSLLRHGADDILTWHDGDHAGMQALLALLTRWDRIDRALSSDAVQTRLIGTSNHWRHVVQSSIEAAIFSQAPVLICGPTGTGKELLAQLIHDLDQRTPKREHVTVDCTTLSKELSGSELFGHEKGAFTGAAASREGAVELADGGTLFLDEIGELPLDLQAQFLRVLQERTFKRVGATRWQTSSFRLVCATNRDLSAEVQAGRFRRDLYHRVAGTTIRTPSLAQRIEDIVPLAEHFLREALGSDRAPALSDAARSYLSQRSYEGNVRELRQLVLAMAMRYVGAGPLTIGTLPAEDRHALLAQTGTCVSWRDSPELLRFVESALACNTSLRELTRTVEDAAVHLATQQCGKLSAAAVKLGVSERTLQVRRAASRDGTDDN